MRNLRYKKLFNIIPVLSLLIFTACLVDIRPTAIQGRGAPGESARARAILMKAIGGTNPGGNNLKKWRALSGVIVDMRDEWFGLAHLIDGWPGGSQRMRFAFMPGSDDGVMELLNANGSSAGVVWGIHDWNTWKRENGALKYEQDAEIAATLPTMEYFLEAPFRLLESNTLIDYAGRHTYKDGTTYDLVYVTWGTVAPQDAIDQYLVFVNTTTGRMERIDATVRETMPFLSISIFYRDFRPVGDFILPHEIDITERGDPPQSSHHTYKIKEWKLNVGLKRSTYAPENRSPRSKF